MEWIAVEVVVNHGGRRRGDRLALPATDETLALVMAGYLTSLGPAAAPPAVVEPVQVVVIPPMPPPPDPRLAEVVIIPPDPR